jgi:hypothetical protein
MVIEQKKTKVLGSTLTTRINNYKVEYGVLDRDNARSCFINIGGYINPLDNNINEVMKKFRHYLTLSTRNYRDAFENLDRSMPPVTVVEWSEENTQGLKNKNSYFNIEFCIYFSEIVKLKKIEDDIFLFCYCVTDFLDQYQEVIFSSK